MRNIKRKNKILLIDDELSFLQMYGLKLGRAGFEVQICQNSRDSLKKIREFKPDIVFLDLVMAKQDGLQVLKKIKATSETKWLPVIMLTNIDNAADRQLCSELGASHYLIKVNMTPGRLVEYTKKILSLV